MSEPSTLTARTLMAMGEPPVCGGRGSDGGAAGVDGDHRARDVARLVRRDEGDDLGDLFDVSCAPHQRRLAQLFDPLRAGAVGVDGPGRDSVDANARGTELSGPGA